MEAGTSILQSHLLLYIQFEASPTYMRLSNKPPNLYKTTLMRNTVLNLCLDHLVRAPRTSESFFHTLIKSIKLTL